MLFVLKLAPVSVYIIGSGSSPHRYTPVSTMLSRIISSVRASAGALQWQLFAVYARIKGRGPVTTMEF